MSGIQIKNEVEIENGWKFAVSVDDAEFEVEVGKEYWQKLTSGKETSEKLIERSFEFLLAREPKESILKKFDLSVIQTYFPEYENKMLEK